jgi:hypothetical protein
MFRMVLANKRNDGLLEWRRCVQEDFEKLQ